MPTREIPFVRMEMRCKSPPPALKGRRAINPTAGLFYSDQFTIGKMGRKPPSSMKLSSPSWIPFMGTEWLINPI